MGNVAGVSSKVLVNRTLGLKTLGLINGLLENRDVVRKITELKTWEKLIRHYEPAIEKEYEDNWKKAVRAQDSRNTKHTLKLDVFQGWQSLIAKAVQEKACIYQPSLVALTVKLLKCEDESVVLGNEYACEAMRTLTLCLPLPTSEPLAYKDLHKLLEECVRSVQCESVAVVQVDTSVLIELLLVLVQLMAGKAHQQGNIKLMGTALIKKLIAVAHALQNRGEFGSSKWTCSWCECIRHVIRVFASDLRHVVCELSLAVATQVPSRLHPLLIDGKNMAVTNMLNDVLAVHCPGNAVLATHGAVWSTPLQEIVIDLQQSIVLSLEKYILRVQMTHKEVPLECGVVQLMGRVLCVYMNAIQHSCITHNTTTDWLTCMQSVQTLHLQKHYIQPWLQVLQVVLCDQWASLTVHNHEHIFSTLCHMLETSYRAEQAVPLLSTLCECIPWLAARTAPKHSTQSWSVWRSLLTTTIQYMSMKRMRQAACHVLTALLTNDCIEWSVSSVQQVHLCVCSVVLCSAELPCAPCIQLLSVYLSTVHFPELVAGQSASRTGSDNDDWSFRRLCVKWLLPERVQGVWLGAVGQETPCAPSPALLYCLLLLTARSPKLWATSRYAFYRANTAPERCDSLLEENAAPSTITNTDHILYERALCSLWHTPISDEHSTTSTVYYNYNQSLPLVFDRSTVHPTLMHLVMNALSQHYTALHQTIKECDADWCLVSALWCACVNLCSVLDMCQWHTQLQPVTDTFKRLYQELSGRLTVDKRASNTLIAQCLSEALIGHSALFVVCNVRGQNTVLGTVLSQALLTPNTSDTPSHSQHKRRRMSSGSADRSNALNSLPMEELRLLYSLVLHVGDQVPPSILQLINTQHWHHTKYAFVMLDVMSEHCGRVFANECHVQLCLSLIEYAVSVYEEQSCLRVLRSVVCLLSDAQLHTIQRKSVQLINYCKAEDSDLNICLSLKRTEALTLLIQRCSASALWNVDVQEDSSGQQDDPVLLYEQLLYELNVTDALMNKILQSMPQNMLVSTWHAILNQMLHVQQQDCASVDVCSAVLNVLACAVQTYKQCAPLRMFCVSVFVQLSTPPQTQTQTAVVHAILCRALPCLRDVMVSCLPFCLYSFYKTQPADASLDLFPWSLFVHETDMNTFIRTHAAVIYTYGYVVHLRHLPNKDQNNRHESLFVHALTEYTAQTECALVKHNTALVLAAIYTCTHTHSTVLDLQLQYIQLIIGYEHKHLLHNTPLRAQIIAALCAHLYCTQQSEESTLVHQVADGFLLNETQFAAVIKLILAATGKGDTLMDAFTKCRIRENDVCVLLVHMRTTLVHMSLSPAVSAHNIHRAITVLHHVLVDCMCLGKALVQLPDAHCTAAVVFSADMCSLLIRLATDHQLLTHIVHGWAVMPLTADTDIGVDMDILGQLLQSINQLVTDKNQQQTLHIRLPVTGTQTQTQSQYDTLLKHMHKHIPCEQHLRLFCRLSLLELLLLSEAQLKAITHMVQEVADRDTHTATDHSNEHNQLLHSTCSQALRILLYDECDSDTVQFVIDNDNGHTKSAAVQLVLLTIQTLAHTHNQTQQVLCGLLERALMCSPAEASLPPNDQSNQFNVMQLAINVLQICAEQLTSTHIKQTSSQMTELTSAVIGLLAVIPDAQLRHIENYSWLTALSCTNTAIHQHNLTSSQSMPELQQTYSVLCARVSAVTGYSSYTLWLYDAVHMMGVALLIGLHTTKLLSDKQTHTCIELMHVCIRALQLHNHFIAGSCFSQLLFLWAYFDVVNMQKTSNVAVFVQKVLSNASNGAVPSWCKRVVVLVHAAARYLRSHTLAEKDSVAQSQILALSTNPFNVFSMARSAHACALQTATVYWCERACDHIITSSAGGVDSLSVSEQQNVQAHKQMMSEACVLLIERDRLTGLGDAILAQHPVRELMYETSDEWYKLAALYTNTNTDKQDNTLKLARALDYAGIAQSTQHSALHYQAAWHLAQWTLPDTKHASAVEYDQALYSAQHALADNRPAQATNTLLVVRNELSASLCAELRIGWAQVERVSSLLDRLSETQSVRLQHERVHKAVVHMHTVDVGVGVMDTLTECKSLLSTQMAVYTHANIDNEQRTQLLLSISSIVCQQAAHLRRRNLNMKALCYLDGYERWLQTEHKPVAQTSNIADEAVLTQKHVLEQIKCSWQHGDTALARNRLQQLCERLSAAAGLHDLDVSMSEMDTPPLNGPPLTECARPELVISAEHKQLLSRAYLRMAAFQQHEASTNQSHTALSYYHKAIQVLSDDGEQRSVSLSARAQHTLADYMHVQYRRLSEYVQSADHQRTKSRTQHARTQIHKQQSQPRDAALPRPSPKYWNHLKNSLRMQEHDVSQVNEQLQEAFKGACCAYMAAMRLSNDFDMDMYRVCSLWLHAHAQWADPKDLVSQMILDNVSCVSSAKWLCVWPQLVSRLRLQPATPSRTNFTQAIGKIVWRCAQEHPFHTFYTLLCVSNNTQAKNTDPQSDAAQRVKAADVLVTRLLKTGAHYKQMLHLTNAYLTFDARNKTMAKGMKGQTLKMPDNDPLLTGCFTQVAFPTMSIPINVQGQYDNVPKVQCFKPDFSVSADGVSEPVFLWCVCSDGNSYKQIVKTNDDLRQDAVMQQAFGVANRMFSQTACTRNLTLRTYVIQPLSPQAGIIQFCQGTKALLDVLKSLHERYPSELDIVRARTEHYHEYTQTRNVHNKDSRLLANFHNICARLRPVLRHFLFDTFADCEQWMHAQTMYTRSAAVTSMVGHLLGIGDRHCSNIMLDTQTAELVHIDFGVGFETGRCLTTPELVPFRLTREMIDPMGVCTVHGLFTRTAEATLTLLRTARSADVLLSIVSVLLHDPLNDWSLNEARQERVQPAPAAAKKNARKSTGRNSKVPVVQEECTSTTSPVNLNVSEQTSSSQLNMLAERALHRLADKLAGRELVHEQPMGVHRQVAYLIAQARDHGHLSQIFPGWRPHL